MSFNKRTIRTSAHCFYDLKYHLVWTACTKKNHCGHVATPSPPSDLTNTSYVATSSTNIITIKLTNHRCSTSYSLSNRSRPAGVAGKPKATGPQSGGRLLYRVTKKSEISATKNTANSTSAKGCKHTYILCIKSRSPCSLSSVSILVCGQR